MNKRKRPVYFTLLIVILAGFAIGNSACSVDDLGPQSNEQEDGIVAKNLDKNTETKFTKDYSHSKEDGFVSYYARNDDGASASITLDDPEGDGVEGTDEPLTEQDLIVISDVLGNDTYIKKGTYTIDEYGRGKIIGNSTITDEGWEIIIGRFNK